MKQQFRLTVALLALASLCAVSQGQDAETRPFTLPSQDAVTNFLTTLAKPLIVGADYLFGFLNMQQPDSSFPEQTQHKQQALTDHTNDAIYMSTSQQIVERSGFKQVTHYITTADGYITELINVINPLADRTKLRQFPLIIFHGGLVDTNTWLWGSSIQHHPEKYPRSAEDGPITSSNRSLGMMLTNYGYDVWLAATRGCNRNNIGHVNLTTKLLEDIILNPADPEAPKEILDTLKFYEYSQDELVEFAFPKQIETVMELTNSSKVNTITYSFSTQIMFKLLASNKELAPKIHTNCAIQPILNRVGVSTATIIVQDFLRLVPDSIGNFFQQLLLSHFTRDLLRALDRYTLTYRLITLVVGSSPRYQTFFEDPVLGHVLQPTSFVEIKHYIQQITPGRLQKYDHGPAKNLELYGQLKPPGYELSDIPIKNWMLVGGDTDILGTISSADAYAAGIPSKPYQYIRRVNGWNHLDSVAAFEVDTIVNLPVLDFFNHFSGSTNST